MKTYRDIQGDGGSDVLAQVEAQGEAIALALADVRRSVSALKAGGTRLLGYVENMDGYYCHAWPAGPAQPLEAIQTVARKIFQQLESES